MKPCYPREGGREGGGRREGGRGREGGREAGRRSEGGWEGVREGGNKPEMGCMISKLVEVIMLDRIEMYMNTNPNQFGFKRKHGTDQCIYVLKEIIDLYRRLNGSVFVCFLDASKAYDRVNHRTLFKQLGARGIPGYILRILIYWYKNQDMCIRWGDAYSAKFKVANGVRQVK